MSMRQKLGAGLVLSALLTGVSFAAQAKVDTLGAVEMLPLVATDAVYPAQQNVGDGKLQVAVRTGVRRRSFRFRGHRTSRSGVRSNSNSVSHTGINRRSARFNRIRSANRAARANTNSVARTGAKRRSFRFRGRHGRRR